MAEDFIERLKKELQKAVEQLRLSPDALDKILERIKRKNPDEKQGPANFQSTSFRFAYKS